MPREGLWRPERVLPLRDGVHQQCDDGAHGHQDHQNLGSFIIRVKWDQCFHAARIDVATYETSWFPGFLLFVEFS